MTPLRDDNMQTTVDENFEPKRAGDHSMAMRINSVFLRYNWLFALIIAALIAAGFDWKTPKAQFESLHDEIAANRVATEKALDSLSRRADVQEDGAAKVVDILEIFSIDLCLRRRADPYVFQRLRCDTVLRTNGGSRR